MVFTIKTAAGTTNITRTERTVAHHINPEVSVKQWGLGVQAPWQNGPTLEWYDSEDDADAAEAHAAGRARS